jgi:phage shock protein PspC (stress-responsive transcriptional regulator)
MNRLYRSRRDRVLTGVSGGLAERIDIDPSLVRIGWVVLAFASSGLFALVYLVMAIVVPEEPDMPPGPPPPWPFESDGPDAAATAWPAGSPIGAPPPGGTTQLPTSPLPPPQAPGKRDERTSALVLGGVLVVAGLFLLSRQLLPAIDADLVWPVVVVALGVLLLLGATRRR